MLVDMLSEDSVRARYEYVKRQYELCLYISQNGCESWDMFLNNLLSDVRVGKHLDWYDACFQDARFMERVSELCESYGRHVLFFRQDELYRELSMLSLIV